MSKSEEPWPGVAEGAMPPPPVIEVFYRNICAHANLDMYKHKFYLLTMPKKYMNEKKYR